MTDRDGRSPETRMRAIFISYRRDDAEGHAGRLFEDLADRFGKASVFMDVTGIEPGRDFRHVIEQQVASCGVLLAVIGKSWLAATDAEGRRRLDDPYDFVRLETEAALKRDIPVVPVLVHGAHMPRPEQLPGVLTDLAFRNSVELTHARWGSDVQLLISALLPYVDAAPQPTSHNQNAYQSASPVSSAGTDEEPPTRGASGLASSTVAQPGRAQAKKPLLFALAAALAIMVAFVGYFVPDWTDKAKPPQPAGPTLATPAPADKAAPLPPVATAAPTPPAEKLDAAGVASEKAGPGSTVAQAVPVQAPRPSAAAAPAKETVAPGQADKSQAGNKTAHPSVARADAERIARANASVKKLLAPDPEAMAAAKRLAADKADAERLARATPAVKKDAEAKPEPVAPVAKPPTAPSEADGGLIAKVEPNRGNTGIALLGDPASPAWATRTIAIYPDTRYVNVTGGEVVKFTVGDKSFAWNFNGRPSSFDLNAVAPPGVMDHKVKAYIAPNPLYPHQRR